VIPHAIRRRGAVTLALALVALALRAAPAGADTGAAMPRARLAYDVAPDAVACPSADDFRAAVAARVGHVLFGEPADLTIALRIRRAADRYIASVAISDANGDRGAPRELESNVGCAELVSAAALVASIAVDPGVLLRPAPPPIVRAPPRAPRTWRAALGVGARALWGLTPAVEPALVVSAAVLTARYALGVDVRATRDASVTYNVGQVTVRPLALSVLPCRDWARFEACLVATIAFMHGGGAGFDDNYQVGRMMGGGGARGAWFVDAGRVRLRLTAQAEVLLPRTRFQVGDATVYTTQSVSVSAGLDALILF
jgi:hypothetical protein